jgi:hypothetical protein
LMLGRQFHNARRKTVVRMWGLLLTVCLSGCIVVGDDSSNILRLNTRCAPGYSEEAFMTIEVGDSEEKVLDLLGEPLERSASVNPLREYLWYTKPIGPSENYLLRNIVVEDGKVVRVYSQAWWD